jgi:hypothetical protein
MNTPLVSLDILSFLVATGFGFFCAGAAGATFVAVSPMMSLTSRDDAIVAFLSFEYGLVRCSNEDVQVANARLTCSKVPQERPASTLVSTLRRPLCECLSSTPESKIWYKNHHYHSSCAVPPIKLFQDGRTCDEGVGHPARPTSQYHKSS